MQKRKKLVPKKDLHSIVRSLQKREATVTFTFRSERYNIREGKTYFNLSHQVMQIGEKAFLQHNGDRKTPYQLWEMLNDIKHDLGATYFVIS